MSKTIKIQCNAEPLLGALRSFKRVIKGGNLPVQVLESLVDFALTPVEFAEVQSNGQSTLTGDLLVTLAPSERFNVLLAAIGAGDFDLGVVEKT